MRLCQDLDSNITDSKTHIHLTNPLKSYFRDKLKRFINDKNSITNWKEWRSRKQEFQYWP